MNVKNMMECGIHDNGNYEFVEVEMNRINMNAT